MIGGIEELRNEFGCLMDGNLCMGPYEGQINRLIRVQFESPSIQLVLSKHLISVSLVEYQSFQARPGN